MMGKVAKQRNRRRYLLEKIEKDEREERINIVEGRCK